MPQLYKSFHVPSTPCTFLHLPFSLSHTHDLEASREEWRGSFWEGVLTSGRKLGVEWSTVVPTITAANGKCGHPCTMKENAIFPTMCQRVIWLCTWESITRDMWSRSRCSTILSSRLCWIRLRMSTISLHTQSSIFLALSIFSSLSFALQALQIINHSLSLSESLCSHLLCCRSRFLFHLCFFSYQGTCRVN